jgi:hypothetical protein
MSLQKRVYSRARTPNGIRMELRWSWDTEQYEWRIAPEEAPSLLAFTQEEAISRARAAGWEICDEYL